MKLAECMPGNRKVVHHIIVFVQPPMARMSQLGRRGAAGGDAAGGEGGQNVARDEDGKPEQAATGTRAAGNRAAGAAVRGAADRWATTTSRASASWPVSRRARGRWSRPTGWPRRSPPVRSWSSKCTTRPVGRRKTDRSSIGLIFMDKKDVTQQMSTTNAAFHQLEIPAGEANYTCEARKTFSRDTLLLSLFPHMHIRGKSFRYEVTYPDGKHEVLLDVPRYDFNWQNSFILAEPKLIPKGTQLLCTAVFDNSPENIYNPDPTKTIRWGPQTWDEMMIGWYDVSFPIAEVEKLIEKDKQIEKDGAKEATSGDAAGSSGE